MKKLSIFLTFGLAVTQLYSQQPEIEWQKSLGGSLFDEAHSVQQTSDGGYIILGLSNSTDGDISENIAWYDFWLVKLNNTGEIEWKKNRGGTSTDQGYHVQQTTDGGYIIVGETTSFDGDVTGNHGGGADGWVAKLNATGDIQWEKALGGSAGDNIVYVQQTSDGGYILAGYSASDNFDATGNHGGADFFVVKLNSSGDSEWKKLYGGSGDEKAYCVQQTSDNGFIVAGSSDSNDGDVTGNHGQTDSWIVKLTGTGDIQWQKSFGGSDYEISSSVRQTPDGGYIMAGTSFSQDGDITGNHGASDFWVVKINNSGDIQWQKSLGGSYGESAYSIQLASDGGYLAAGSTFSNDGDVSGLKGAADFWLVKLNDSGNLQWQKCMGGSDLDVALSVKQTSDSGFIVVGSSSSNDGDVTGNHGDWDYWVVKLGPENLDTNEIKTGNEISIYPNPVKNMLTINGLTIESPIILTNLNGEIVYRAVAKTATETIDVSGLPAGVYFINKQKFIKR